MANIGRGTTPLLKFKINGLSNIEVKQVWITFSDPYKGQILNLNINDVNINGDYITVRLSQMQTLSIENEKLMWQIRLLDSNDLAYISGEPKPINIIRILKEGVITDGTSDNY